MTTNLSTLPDPRPAGAKTTDHTDEHTPLFALPIVFVAGAQRALTIPGTLPDIATIKQRLQAEGILDASGQLGAALVDHAQLEAMQPDSYQHNHAPSFSLKAGEDGVFLRYLLGTQTAAKPTRHKDIKGSMALSQLLGEQLKQDGLTLFPLPRAPQPWRMALEDGRVARQEIRLQVFVSNTLRKLREAGETPVAVLSSHVGTDTTHAEIRLTIGAENNSEAWAGFIWPLGELDQVHVLQQNMVNLLQECQQNAIQVITEVLPTIKQHLPYFPLPQDLVTQALATANITHH